MRKKAMTNNDPEGGDQEAIMDPVRALIVFPNDPEKSTEPTRTPSGAGRVSEREERRPYTNLKKMIIIRFGSNYNRSRSHLSLQRLSEQNFLLSSPLQT
jgi:hypothetical protein